MLGKEMTGSEAYFERQEPEQEITIILRNEYRSKCLPENLIEQHPWCADIKYTCRTGNSKAGGVWEISYSFLEKDVLGLKEKSPHLFL